MPETQIRDVQFIDGLPYEILNEIGVQLPAKDALSLIRCSRRCAAIVGWSLYHQDSLNGHWAICWGARSGQLSAVKMAVAHGAGPLSPVIDPGFDFGETLTRETALSIAIENNKIDVVQYLLQGCHAVDGLWAQKSYLLHSVKCPKLMEVLLTGGFSSVVNTLGTAGWDDDVTPLVAAIEGNHPECVIRTLLKFGAKPNSQNVSSMRPHMSAFHICLKSDRPSVANILIDHNADVNEAEGPELWSNTPLGAVLRQCQPGVPCNDELVASLLRHGADPNSSTRGAGAGPRPIILATSPDVLPKTFERLIAKGARVNNGVKVQLEDVLLSTKSDRMWWDSTPQRQIVRNTDKKLQVLRQLGNRTIPEETI
ncbi:ankyrin repeat-containing domain protein [Colletotrichum phormii]|uniref:Ankyrin repeat-containing domain protein n=1 Tax=Colletotrichum phormii TaxID=359342 RepID=A0AAI9ZPK3_9PEZI|nr:ankyrin repeat-containing domain protein [Colletotrichum phormii]KAK1635825.1 ankyrin repeat-containing domain protein [Colletotrichum phormii]